MLLLCNLAIGILQIPVLAAEANYVLKLVEYFQEVIGDYQPETLLGIVLPAQARDIEGLGELVGMGEYASFFEIIPANERKRASFPEAMMDFPLHVPSTWFAEFEPGPIEENAMSWLCNPWRFYYGGRAMVDIFNWSEDEYRMSLYHTWLAYEEANKGKEILPIYRDAVVNNEKKIRLFSYTLDQEIRRVTNGEKGVNDVIHYLYENYALKGKEVTSNDFIEAVNLVTGHDFTEFFNKYFYGTEKFPLVVEFEEKGTSTLEVMSEHGTVSRSWCLPARGSGNSVPESHRAPNQSQG